MIPRSLGLSAPEGSDVYEFLFTVKSRPSILGKISDIFGKNNSDIIGIHGQVSDDRKTGYIIVYAEMKDSKLTPEELAETIKKQEYIVDVVYEQKNTKFFEGFLFPLTSGGHYRVFAVGSNEWASLVRSLHQTFGTASASLLYEQGVSVGKAMIERIGSRFSSYPGAGLIMENFALLFRAAGFGILRIEYEEKGIVARINSPLVGKNEDFIDYFTIGIVSGAVSSINNASYRVKETKFLDDLLEVVLEKE